MKKFMSILMAMTLVVCSFAAFTFTSSAEEKELLETASEWEYIVVEETGETATATAPEGWLDGSDSAEWEKSYAPFAGAGGNGMATHFFEYGKFSAFLRTTFTVEDLSKIVGLDMSVIYDENPTVYLNGEVFWSAEGYQDKDYGIVNMNDKISLLKEGENTVCVVFSNVYGGSIFDMGLTYNDELIVVGEDGYVLFSGATHSGYSMFNGTINQPNNILDGDASTVSGNNWKADAEEPMTLTANFMGAAKITSVYVQCKNEGTTSHEDGITRGTYDLYAINGETETKLNSEPVPAMTDADGGYTVTLEQAMEATAVKIVITDWYGTNWACVADVMVTAEVPAEPEPPVIDPTPSEEPSEEPSPSVEPSEEPTPSEQPSEAPSEEPAPSTGNDETPSAGNEATPDASEENKTSESKPADKNDDKDDDKDDNSGAIIGIVVAVVAVVAIAVVIVLVVKKKKA